MNTSQVVVLFKRYRFFMIMLVILIGLTLVQPELGGTASNLALENLIDMMAVVPPIFILLGLLDVWVPREVMIKLTGEGSGLLGITLAFLLGSFAAGPLYAAFPIAGIMLKKGSKLSNIMIFIGAWSTTKVPMLLYEASAMGFNFMLGRFLLNIPVIMIIGFVVQKSLPQKDLEALYEAAEKL
ncbi:MAG: permease [Eubacteriales bacterium]|nr:permease [Eubacteriales bacterium]